MPFARLLNPSATSSWTDCAWARPAPRSRNPNPAGAALNGRDCCARRARFLSSSPSARGNVGSHLWRSWGRTRTSAPSQPTPDQTSERRSRIEQRHSDSRPTGSGGQDSRHSRSRSTNLANVQTHRAAWFRCCPSMARTKSRSESVRRRSSNCPPPVCRPGRCDGQRSRDRSDHCPRRAKQ